MRSRNRPVAGKAHIQTRANSTVATSVPTLELEANVRTPRTRAGANPEDVKHKRTQRPPSRSPKLRKSPISGQIPRSAKTMANATIPSPIVGQAGACPVAIANEKIVPAPIAGRVRVNPAVARIEPKRALISGGSTSRENLSLTRR
jgi:hypothetical protein